MGFRESISLHWPLFTNVVHDFPVAIPFSFGFLHSIGNNFDLLWTDMVLYGAVEDGISDTMELLIINTWLGLSTAIGYAALADTSLMSVFQQGALFCRLSLGYLVSLIVIGLYGSVGVGHGNLDIMMSLLTNSWLGLFHFWVSTSKTDAISFHVVRVLFPPSRGVVVRVVMCFTHGVFPGVLGVFGFFNSDFMNIYNPQRIWDPGIILEVFCVKISTDVYGVKCTIGWAYTGATSLSYVMWSFNERMPKRHTYHIRVRWILKKEYIMFYNMIASKAYRKEASSISLFHLCPLQHMVHKSAYVKVCFCEVLYGLNTVVILFI